MRAYRHAHTREDTNRRLSQSGLLDLMGRVDPDLHRMSGVELRRILKFAVAPSFTVMVVGGSREIELCTKLHY